MGKFLEKGGSFLMNYEVCKDIVSMYNIINKHSIFKVSHKYSPRYLCFYAPCLVTIQQLR